MEEKIDSTQKKLESSENSSDKIAELLQKIELAKTEHPDTEVREIRIKMEDNEGYMDICDRYVAP